MTSFHSYFSSTYKEARKRFIQLSEQKNGALFCYKIGSQSSDGEELTIDVARFGDNNAENLVIISSGTHGVEGFFGSAAQLAILDNKLNEIIENKNTALVLIHAVNPFGFSHLRRVNESNIDLNRNCMHSTSEYIGADPNYATMNELLNPKTPPKFFDLFLVKGLVKIIQHGLPSLKNSIAQGQYEYPKGLFFGGKKLSKSMEIIRENLPTWVGTADNIIHIDLHTGLGKPATYVLAYPPDTSIALQQQVAEHFGKERIQSLEKGKVLYTIRGEFNSFCRDLLPTKNYLPLLAEFGTKNIIRVISALRYENQVWHWATQDSSIRKKAAENLREVFSPSSKEWQNQVIAHTFVIVKQSIGFLETN